MVSHVEGNSELAVGLTTANTEDTAVDGSAVAEVGVNLAALGNLGDNLGSNGLGLGNVLITTDGNVVDVQEEHVGHVVVADGDATLLTLILAQVKAVLGHGAGNGLVSAYLNKVVDVGGIADAYKHTELLGCITSILAASPQFDTLAESHNGRDEPVVGGQGSASPVVITCRCHEAISAVSGHEASFLALVVEVLPVKAVTIVVENHPVGELVFALKVPNDVVVSLECVVGSGNCIEVKSLECGAGQYVHVTLLDGHGLALACHSLHFLDTGLNVVDQFVIDTCRCAQRNCNCNQKYR